MGDRVRITLTHALLEELGTGQKVLLFHFSAGADQSLTLTVADSAPRRTVSFYLDAADSLPYCRAADIRDGGVLGTLPPQPTKEGYLFTGWYLSDGTTRITADTVVRADVSVYAAWSSSSGPAGGGGLGGGGGAASDEGDAVIDRLPAGAAVYDAETVSALLRGGAVLLEDGGAGVALSGAAAQAAAEAGAEVTVSGTAGRLTLSPGLLAALDAGDADQIFLIVEPAEAPSGWLEAAGFSSADVAVSVRLRILIYTAEGEPAAVQLQEPARLALRAGTEFADRSLSVLSGEPGAAASAEEVRADGTGWADLAAAAPAVYVVCSPEAPPFTDVEKTDWFYTGVRYVSFCGLMTGTGAGLFAPRATATRAMLAEILYRMAGSPASEAENIFDDAASGAWYADAVRWAAGSGVISGYGDGRFGPEDPVTREQLAVLLARYAGSPAAETDYVGTFSDGGEASAYAVAALNWAVERGILTGRGDGTLDPAGIAGRAEIAAMLARFDAAGAGEASGAQAR